jgi:hypothetical protein
VPLDGKGIVHLCASPCERAAAVPAGVGRFACREVEAPLVPFRPHVDYRVLRTTATHGLPSQLMRGPRIAQHEVDVSHRCARLPNEGESARSDGRRRPVRPRPCGAAGRHRVRPAVRGQPVGTLNCARPVLIAAILLPAIHEDGTTRVGACRAWSLSKPADDRRGTDSVRTIRAQFRCPTRVAAADAVPPPRQGDAAATR